MSTYRELTYLILDELKGISDDFSYTDSHIMFMLSKYRSLLLKQRYSDIKKQIPENNYQTICLDLMEVPAICGEHCEGGSFLRSKAKIPFAMQIGTPSTYPINYYYGNIAFVSRDRMKYVGYNKYLKNIIYCSIAPDNHLYFKSANPQFLSLERVKFTAIFQDAQEASLLECNDSGEIIPCDIMDRTFPIEEALIPPMMELIVKELAATFNIPKDDDNNAHDDIPKQ